ncbi:hypothetical protein CEXT_384481 [Caerostris extrusa]|uniref:DM14 domain-containing protein n=1 Tax=Caerostris extrusa TaxID=172846 RepID=A0AAV4Q0S8_CAEEX|nr:hypothetical protein CEXT_384481 [Caerostris extrusa]
MLIFEILPVPPGFAPILLPNGKSVEKPKEEALKAKKNGDLQKAKEYLKMSKGFDSLIEATKCGLPIDVTTIPKLPELEPDFIVLEKTNLKVVTKKMYIKI